MTLDNKAMVKLTLIPILATALVACGGSGGGSSSGGGSGSDGDDGTGGSGGGSTISTPTSNLDGSIVDQSGSIDGIELRPFLTSNGNTRFTFQPVEYDGATVYPVGSASASGDTEIALIANVYGDGEPLVGIDSNQNAVTSLDQLGNVNYDVGFTEFFYNSDGSPNGLGNGGEGVAMIDANAGDITFAAADGDDWALEGYTGTWQELDTGDGETTMGFYYEDDEARGAAFLFGDEIAGAYGGATADGGITGTFAGQQQ